MSLSFKERVKLEEGFRAEAYLDTTGNWTIGFGHHDKNVHAGMVWSEEEAESQLDVDIANVTKALDTSLVFGWWRELNQPRQDVILDMAFNMGLRTFTGFTTFLVLTKAGKYAEAAADGLTTRWAKQVKGRAVRLMKQLESGEWQ